MSARHAWRPRLLGFLFLVTWFSGLLPAAGDEPTAARSPAQAADLVVAAHEAGDGAALKALASANEPEPWVVAEELCERGQHDAAEAFARAAPRAATRALPDYVASRRGKVPDKDAGERLDVALAAAGDGRWEDVLLAVEPVKGRLDTVVRIRCAFARGIALGATGRKRECTRTLAEVGRVAAGLGWLGIASAALQSAGLEAYRISDWPAALRAWQARLEVVRRLEDKPAVARTLASVGNVHLNRGDYREARAFHTESLAIKRELGDTRGIARSLGSMGVIERSLGNYSQALACYEESLRLARDLGDAWGVAQMLGNIGNVHLARGDYRLALARHEEALGVFTSLGKRGSMALALNSIADVQHTLGDYDEALRRRREALEHFAALGDQQHAARALGGLGSTYLARGNYAEALAHYEDALGLARKLGDASAVAAWLACLGAVQGTLGNQPQALVHYEESLAVARSLGEQQSIALALMNVGGAKSSLGAYAEALPCYEEALRLRRDQGDKAGVARVLLNLGILEGDRGAYEASLARHRDALETFRTLEDGPGAAQALLGIGFALRHRGDDEESAVAYQKALEVLGSTGSPAVRARALGGLAHVRLHQDRPAASLRLAREGIGLVSSLAQGLAEGEGAGARDTYASLFDVGMRAALQSGDAAAEAWMLEHGRAGTLREMLGARQALQTAVIPEELGQALTLAELAEQTARRERLRARGSGSPEDLQHADAALAKAQEDVLAVVARIQREAKAAASLVLPAPDDVDTIRGYLRAGEALVVYGLGTDTALALVVEPHGARMVRLAPAEEVRKAVDALLRDGPPHVEPAGIPGLVKLIATPLTLGKDVRRVLVSPVDRLGYVPFALIFPEREVVCVPSGTTLGLLLREKDKRGAKVLAVGDPDYRTVTRPLALALHRGGEPDALAPLPGTRAEVQALGDVTLLGDRATESGVVHALRAQTRWRALHLACHGWVNPERPLLSALALTATGDDDGLLTCLDVFRMRIPADLVVLSACETGRGRLYATEGIVGLTRAFMFAGAPRVVASLWKVDDEATRALMVRFYELWNPREDAGSGKKGLSAAAALREAQAHVRTYVREEVDVEASRKAGRTVIRRSSPWQHPAYWAGWVLWGLPE